MDVQIKNMTPNDEGRTKFKDIKGHTYKLQAKDPYGFWYILDIKETTPQELTGSYTSYGAAVSALENYHNKAVVEMKKEDING